MPTMSGIHLARAILGRKEPLATVLRSRRGKARFRASMSGRRRAGPMAGPFADPPTRATSELARGAPPKRLGTRGLHCRGVRGSILTQQPDAVSNKAIFPLSPAPVVPSRVPNGAREVLTHLGLAKVRRRPHRDVSAGSRPQCYLVRSTWARCNLSNYEGSDPSTTSPTCPPAMAVEGANAPNPALVGPGHDSLRQTLSCRLGGGKFKTPSHGAW